MAGTSRFHDKLHRANHHSVVSPGLPDSAYDPIASKDHPFRGDFVLSGALSARGDCTTESFTARKTLKVNEETTLLGPLFTNSGGSYVTHHTFANNKIPLIPNRTISFNYDNGVYINGFPPKLIVGTKGSDAGLVQVTNIDAVSASLLSATISDRLGIGTTTPQHELHVVGDVIIYGTLTANGNSYFQNTLFTTTSSLSIVNTGTGAGLTVSQEGNQPIVALYDHESSISLWADGHADRPGWVGIKTSDPNVELTVHGDISSSGVVYGSSSNSDQWKTTYNTTVANSANWSGGYSSIGANSGTWDSNYTTTNTNSAKWQANYSSTNASSALWNANYTTTNTKSASWDSNYSTVLANSGTWSSGGASNTTLAANSARWNANYTTTNTKSASWDSNYSTVLANSAIWSAGGSGSGSTYNTLNLLSANWNSSYNTLTSTSATWSSVYNTTNANSASWGSGGAISSTVASNSANWNSSYNTLTSTSATWSSVYNTTNANSGDWSSSYVTLLANSATWDAAAGALGDIDLDYLADVSITSNTLADGQVLTYDIGTQQWENSSLVLSGIVQGSSTWESTHVTVQSNSASWNTAYNTVTSLSTSVLTAASIDLTTAEVSTFETELSASGEFLLIRINGVVRKLRLWD
jgi:hypothetical protein